MDEYINKTKFEELMRKKARDNFDLYYYEKSKHHHDSAKYYHDCAIGYNKAADEAYAFPSADVQLVKQENMNKCYFCDNEINSDLTVIICDKTLLQSELFSAKMCPKCAEVLKASITLLKHITPYKEGR